MNEPTDVERSGATGCTQPVPSVVASTGCVQPVAPVPIARSYVWRLLPLVPAIALVAWGWHGYASVPAGAGVATSIKLTTKAGLAGQARDAWDSVVPTTADLFVVVKLRGDGERKLKTFRDTPIGNGLTWRLDPPVDVRDVALVEVWDRRRIIGDKQLDRVAFGGPEWIAQGQTFELHLLGTPAPPPPWALPVLCAGATLGALVALRFVWDQAV